MGKEIPDRGAGRLHAISGYACFLSGGARQEECGSGKIMHGIFSSAIDTLKLLVIAIGAGLGVWGVVNLLEGYGNDNPGANAHVR